MFVPSTLLSPAVLRIVIFVLGANCIGIFVTTPRGSPRALELFQNMSGGRLLIPFSFICLFHFRIEITEVAGWVYCCFSKGETPLLSYLSLCSFVFHCGGFVELPDNFLLMRSMLKLNSFSDHFQFDCCMS